MRSSLGLRHCQRQSVNYFENLSNELFYEIFDYLDGCEIYQAFANLNYRLQAILVSSALRLKIHLSSYLDTNIQHDYMRIITQRKNQILSLRLMYTSMPFDSSFTRLESLIIIGLKAEDDLFQHLSILISLPRLRSLVLCISYHVKDFHEIYKLIFKLPVLKYMKLSSEIYEPAIPLSIATADQFNSIEYLIMDHSCSLKDLICILSYTPQLCRLTCRELIRSMDNIAQGATIYLSKLTYISISECYAVFDRFESFLKRIVCSLRILRVHTYWDAHYLDADRWEGLFVECMPYLEEFCLQHHEFVDDDFQITEYHSSFWNTRHYICQLTIDINDESWSEVIYSIHRDKREYSSDIDLTIIAPLCQKFNHIFTDNILNLLALFQITRLNIPYHDFPVSKLIDLLHHLPDLHTLRIWSLSSSRCTRDELAYFNKITKIVIQSVTELSELQYLLDLCPNIQHL